MNSEGFRETFLRNDREGPTKAEMAGKKEAKQKAGPRGQTEKNREETGSSTGTKNTSEEVGQRTVQNIQRKEAHRDLKGQGEPKKPSMTKRRQARKVATMVRRLKKNPEDGESQPPIEAETDLVSGDGWNAQQQATVTAYAQSRRMQPREVLQALVNSMEKTLRKEKGGIPASQIPPSSVKQKGKAAGRTEAGPNPGRGGRDPRERKPDSNCVACCGDKRRGVPPKTRWKEEQKEKAQSMELSGKENRAMAVPGLKGVVAAMESGGSETQQTPEEAQEGTVATPGPEETATEKESEAPGGAQGARGPKKEDAPAPVACVTGVPRDPANGREVARITRTEGRTPPETLEQVNQQYLKSKYKFKEGAPLKEYLQQRISSFREPCTLVEVLTWLKEIIRDNLLFDERNPAMIVRDAPLEAALRKKKVHVNNIRRVVIQQLTMVEARQGPWNPAMLIWGMTRLGRVPVSSRPEAQAATAPAGAHGARIISLTEVPAGSVVLHRPAPGITEVPARSVVMHNPLPGIQQEIGTVSYTAPA